MLHEGWYWLALAIVCCIISVFQIRAFAVLAVAAASVAIALSLLPLAPVLQMAVFTVVTLLGALLYLKFFYVPQVQLHTPRVKRRVSKLVGTQASLLRGITSGKGKVQLQNAVWTVRCDTKLPTGTMVQVVGYQGAELEVRAIGAGKAAAG